MLDQDSSNNSERDTRCGPDWLNQSSGWGYVLAKPEIELGFKQTPQDFKVRELMPITPQGEGEHWWLHIKKTRCHTAELAKALARFAGVAYRDVSYSGLKDYMAETWQWFSIYQAKGETHDWQNFDFPGARILEVTRHNKKLRRGVHSGNSFEIVLNTQCLGAHAENTQQRQENKIELERRLSFIKSHGVPNYFGPQRFGYNMSNLDKAFDFFTHSKKPPKRLNDRQAMWVSAARAWLFNTVLAERVKQGNWNTLQIGEPCNLNGTQSYFLSTEADTLERRLAHGDIHPTAPMWGGFSPRDKELLGSITPHLAAEQACLSEFHVFKHGLERLGLAYKRRSTRCLPQSVHWYFEENRLVLRFELLSGQYATSVLRELIRS